MANPLWTGIKTLDELRSKAAYESTGVIQVSIEQLNQIGDEVKNLLNIIKQEHLSLIHMKNGKQRKKNLV